MLDVLMVICFIAITIWALAQRLLRQLMSLAALYVATVVSGLFYPHAARFVKAIGGATPRLTQLIMFWILFIAVTIVLETMLRRAFPDAHLPQLGLMDRVLALLPGVLCALIVASLLLTSLGYASQGTWGRLAGMRAGVARSYENAALRPLVSRFLSFYMIAHFLWFSTPPPLLAYALP